METSGWVWLGHGKKRHWGWLDAVHAQGLSAAMEDWRDKIRQNIGIWLALKWFNVMWYDYDHRKL